MIPCSLTPFTRKTVTGIFALRTLLRKTSCKFWLLSEDIRSPLFVVGVPALNPALHDAGMHRILLHCNPSRLQALHASDQLRTGTEPQGRRMSVEFSDQRRIGPQEIGRASRRGRGCPYV